MASSEALTATLFLPPVWADMRAEFERVMAPVLTAVFVAGAVDAVARVGRKATATEIDYDQINRAAQTAVSDELNAAWIRIEQSSRAAVADSIARNIGPGLPGVKGVIRDLREIFGADRAALIATTEVTNVLGRGAITQYRAMGVPQWEWLTVVDSRMCSICEGREGQVFPIDDPWEAAHPRCRCRPAPVVA